MFGYILLDRDGVNGEALSAFGIATTFSFVFFNSFNFGLIDKAGIDVARGHGANNFSSINKALVQGLTTLALQTIFLVLPSVYFAGPVMKFSGFGESNSEAAALVVWKLAPCILIEGLSQFIAQTCQAQ